AGAAAHEFRLGARGGQLAERAHRGAGGGVCVPVPRTGGGVPTGAVRRGAVAAGPSATGADGGVREEGASTTGAMRPGILEGMESTAQQPRRAIDVTGLPEEAIRAVESLVSLLRPCPGPGGPAFSSPEEWAKAIRAWAESHKPPGTSADWSRESIYAGRGE